MKNVTIEKENIMKTIISIILILFIQNYAYSQSLWYKLSVPLEYKQTMGIDTSLTDLKNIVLNRDENIVDLKYVYAVIQLTDKYEQEERDFLLQNLLTLQDTIKLNKNNIDYNSWYYAFNNDMIARGYLGDGEAIDGMRYMRDNPEYPDSVNLGAIYYLTQAGIYEDYQTVRNLVNYPDPNQRYSPCYLSYFIKNPSYEDEIKSIFIPIIKNNQVDGYNYLVNCCINALASVDTASLVEALEWSFINNEGELRLWFFEKLARYDKDNQPERSKRALLDEIDKSRIIRYLPQNFQVGNGRVSIKYADFSWLSFFTNYRKTNQLESIKKILDYDFNQFKPYNDKSITTLENILILSGVIDSCINYNWFSDASFSNELKNILTTANTNLLAGDSLACRIQVKVFQDLVDSVYKDSLNPDARFVTFEGWKFLYWNAQYILDRLPEPPVNPNLVVSLKNSQGAQITASQVKYYDTSWKDAIDNGNGTFTVITDKPTVSVRMFYEGANQTVNNITAHSNAYTFQTVNASVQLKNSMGNLIDQGTVQYYAGAPIGTGWRSFGTTSNGIANKELLPINYSFRMIYEYASIDKQQNLSVDPTVVFQTVNAAVQLKNSLGNFIDVGTVQYYAGAPIGTGWRSFGTTTNGVVTKELLPINYSFRMIHAFLSKDKLQNISTNPVVDFQTVLCSVKVSKSTNQPISNSTVKYYGGAWRDLGVTNASGITTKELLPQNISFRATYGSASQDKQQDIGANSLVEFLLNIP